MGMAEWQDSQIRVYSKKRAKKLRKKFRKVFRKDEVLYGDKLQIIKEKCKFLIHGQKVFLWTFLVGLSCVNNCYVTKGKRWDVFKMEG